MDKVHENTKTRVHCTLSMHIKLQGTYKLGYRIIKEGHQAPHRFPTFNFSLMFIGSTPLSKWPKYGIKDSQWAFRKRMWAICKRKQDAIPINK